MSAELMIDGACATSRLCPQRIDDNDNMAEHDEKYDPADDGTDGIGELTVATSVATCSRRLVSAMWKATRAVVFLIVMFLQQTSD